MLYAIGIGISVFSHITPEANKAIKACRTLYVLSPDASVLTMAKETNPTAKIIDCTRYYKKETNRMDVYETIASEILESHSPYINIGLLTYGNPMFLVSAVERMLLKAENKTVRTIVVPGISSFDTVLADLKMDLGYGVTVIDATVLLAKKIQVNTTLPMLVFQIANLNSEKIERDEIPTSRLISLVEFLLLSYPRGHICKLIVSAQTLFDSPNIHDVEISRLATEGSIDLSCRPTLYIPEIS